MRFALHRCGGRDLPFTPQDGSIVLVRKVSCVTVFESDVAATLSDYRMPSPLERPLAVSMSHVDESLAIASCTVWVRTLEIGQFMR